MAKKYNRQRAEQILKKSEKYLSGGANDKAIDTETERQGFLDSVYGSAKQNIQTIGGTDEVVTSRDNQRQFERDTERVENEERGISTMNEDRRANEEQREISRQEENQVEPNAGITDIGSRNAFVEQNKRELQRRSKEQKQRVRDMYDTSLARNDAMTAETVSRIRSKFDQRIETQERLNSLKVDRAKAYGLAGGGRFQPVNFQDAITEREEEAEKKINDLESERRRLISEARRARDDRETQIMQQKLSALDDVDASIREQLQNIQDEADQQLELFRDAEKVQREEDEARRERMADALENLSVSYGQDYMNQTDEEKQRTVQEIADSTGLDPLTVMGQLEQGAYQAREDNISRAKSKLDVSKKKVDISKKKLDIDKLKQDMIFEARREQTDQVKDQLSIANSRASLRGKQLSNQKKVQDLNEASSGVSEEDLDDDLDEANEVLELGFDTGEEKYNGRGEDGYVDPNAYIKVYNDMKQNYGAKGQTEFLRKFPPEKYINPMGIDSGEREYPEEIRNRVMAG